MDNIGNQDFDSSGEWSHEPSDLKGRDRLPDYWPLRVRRIGLVVALFAVVIFVSGLLLDLLLIRIERVSQLRAAAVLDGLFALVLAILLYRVLVHERDRRKRIIERLEIIDEMNHHIRNALQVISFNAHPESNEFELVEMRRAMNRIQWALREILPKMEPEFDSFEGSARDKAGELPPNPPSS
jgi:hypothetical protein